jgi:hypothetical protein
VGADKQVNNTVKASQYYLSINSFEENFALCIVVLLPRAGRSNFSAAMVLVFWPTANCQLPTANR